MDDAYRDATSLLSHDTPGPSYASVIVDEAQDLGAQAFRFIRALVPEGPDDLFIVGDGHQRIYGRHRVVLGRCGIRIVGRSRKLRLNYRTTEQTRRWAVDLLSEREIDDLDGGRDDNAGFKSLTTGPKPSIVVTDSAEEQWKYLVDYLFARLERDEVLRKVCVVARTTALRDQAKEELQANAIDAVAVGRDKGDEGGPEVVRVATMHRVKGLEFDRVVMVGVNEGVVPWPDRMEDCADDKAKEWAETEERALLYVAATRAKKSLLVLCHGEPSPFLKELGSDRGTQATGDT